MSQQKIPLSLAAAAVALALSPLAPAAENPPGSSGKAISAGNKVRCLGISFCHAFHECGQHVCKTASKCGGLRTTTAKECLDKGGTIAELED